jgi:hypothetical protein
MLAYGLSRNKVVSRKSTSKHMESQNEDVQTACLLIAVVQERVGRLLDRISLKFPNYLEHSRVRVVAEPRHMQRCSCSILNSYLA